MALLRTSALRVLTASSSRIPLLARRSRGLTTYTPSPHRPSTTQRLSLRSLPQQLRRISSGDSTEASGSSENSTASASATAPSATEPVPAAESKALSTIYVGNLFFETDSAKLRETFESYGTIKSVSIATDSRGLSRGFGFVEFEDPADAKQAIMEKDQQILDGRRMAVQIHTPRVRANTRPRRESNAPSRTLFIGNMSFEMTDQDLNELFRDIRNVINVRVAVDRRSGQPRGFAHADFLDVESAGKAAEVLREKVIHGRQLRVDFSMPSSQRRTNSDE